MRASDICFTRVICSFGLAIHVLAPLSGMADSGELAKLKSAQEMASKRKAMSVDFDQSFYSAASKVTRKSKGNLDYLAPNSFRWEVASPRKEVYVNSPKEFWSYQEATRHAQKLAPGSFDMDFVDLALHFLSLEKKYKVSGSKEIEVGPNEFCVELIPLTDGPQKKILLALSEKTASVTQMNIFYVNGNTTKINFKNPSFLPKPESRFDFVPPKGTAIDKN